jgi:hypothetical protein
MPDPYYEVFAALVQAKALVEESVRERVPRHALVRSENSGT